jgi:hypothetical protein
MAVCSRPGGRRWGSWGRWAVGPPGPGSEVTRSLPFATCRATSRNRSSPEGYRTVAARARSRPLGV